MRLLFLCVSVLFFEKGVLKVMTASLKARREVLVICEAECYQKKKATCSVHSLHQNCSFEQQITSVANQHHVTEQGCYIKVEMPVGCDDTWYVCLCSASVV